jgi:hypothetical protein
VQILVFTIRYHQ